MLRARTLVRLVKTPRLCRRNMATEFPVSDVPGAPAVLIEYCQNCDGGGQELSTAQTAILSAFPKAVVTSLCHDDYPIKVTITGNGKLIWTGRQQLLFKKNASDRDNSIAEIQKNAKAILATE